MGFPRRRRLVLSLLVLLPWLGPSSPAFAQGVSAESLRGRTIAAQWAYETRARREGREFDNPVKFELTLNIGGDGSANGTVTRHVVGPRGPQSETRTFSAVIGKPGQTREGHRLMLLSGNTLTMLQTFEVGGAKTTITLGGGGSCTVRSPAMKETGSNVVVRRNAVVGGQIEILSSRQVSSSCRIN
jgi:hypothetical protein